VRFLISLSRLLRSCRLVLSFLRPTPRETSGVMGFFLVPQASHQFIPEGKLLKSALTWRTFMID